MMEGFKEQSLILTVQVSLLHTPLHVVTAEYAGAARVCWEHLLHVLPITPLNKQNTVQPYLKALAHLLY